MDATEITITRHYRLDDPVTGHIVVAQLVYAGGKVAVSDPRTKQRVIISASRLYPVGDIAHTAQKPKKDARTPKKPVICQHYWQITYEMNGEGRLTQIGRCQRCQAKREFRQKFHVSAMQSWDLTGHH